MKQLEIVPTIYEYQSFEEFAEEFSLDEKDLVFTSEHAYKSIISKSNVSCIPVFREKHGQGEPTDVMVNGILNEVKKYDFNRIIAVGGGTIVDIAKIIAVAGDTCDVNDLYENMGALKKQHELIIIPTTCGTGSEVTNISIVNRTTIKTKQGLVSNEMYADYAVLVSEFIDTLPHSVFATSSIDALIHAVESYLSPLSTSFTEMFSVAAIKDILYGYQAIANKEKTLMELSGLFLKASTYAGIAFGNAGCGTIHAMSYAFGGEYHVAHGESNYQFFLPVLNHYKKVKPEGKIVKLESLIAENLQVENSFEALDDLIGKILSKKPMSEYGATQNDLMPFAQSTMEHQQRLLAKSYVPMTLEAVYDIYKSCL